MSAEDPLAKLERDVLTAAGIGSYRKRVDILRKLLAAQSPDVLSIVLAMTMPAMQAQALAAVLDAFGLGATDALDVVDGVEDAAVIRRIGRPSAETRALVAGLDQRGRKALALAQKLARAGADPEQVTVPLIAHANTVGRTVTEAVNRAGNEGSTAVADAAGLATVWVAETSACVRCLAYSGRVAQPGKSFPAGLTYGRAKYAVNGALPHPPLHPYCRCTVEPLRSKEYADALRREADRSVLRGFSLDSESMKTRVEAAERLLAQVVTKSDGTLEVGGHPVPKSVVAYARRSVKAGGYGTRGRR